MPRNEERTNEEGYVFLNKDNSNKGAPEDRGMPHALFPNCSHPDNDYSRIRRSTAGVATTENLQTPPKNYRATFGFANGKEFTRKLKNFDEQRKLESEYPKAKL